MADTALWRELCLTIAGVELDHVPGTAMSQLDDERPYKRTYCLYLETFCSGRNGERLPSEVIWPQPVSRFHLEGSSLPVCDDSATIPAEVLAIVNDTSTADISRSSCDHGPGDSSNS